MSVQQFCLRWNNHQPNFISVCSSLLHNGTLVDVTLAAEGKQLQAHKIVLSACSSYFQTLFATNPCQHPIVILKDVQYDDLKTMVDFMYYGEVNVSQEQLPHILKTAEMLKIKGLAEMPTDPANLTKSESKSLNEPTEFIGNVSNPNPGNTNGTGGGSAGFGGSTSGRASDSIWENTESQFQQQQHLHHQQQIQQQHHHHEHEQLHPQEVNQVQVAQQQGVNRRSPSPLAVGASLAAKRKRLRKSSNNGEQMEENKKTGFGERSNSDDQQNSSLDVSNIGPGVSLSQMCQMSFNSQGSLGGIGSHSLSTPKLLKEASNAEPQQDSDSLDGGRSHIPIQIKPEVDISGVQTIPLDISGTTTPSEHEAPNSQSTHSGSSNERTYEPDPVNPSPAVPKELTVLSHPSVELETTEIPVGIKRNRLLIRQPRIKRDSDSLLNIQTLPEKNTNSRTERKTIKPEHLKRIYADWCEKSKTTESQGQLRNKSVFPSQRIERQSSEPTSSTQLISITKSTPFLIKQLSDPLLPCQQLAFDANEATVNHFAPSSRQYSRLIRDSSVTSALFYDSQHISLPDSVCVPSPPSAGLSQCLESQTQNVKSPSLNYAREKSPLTWPSSCLSTHTIKNTSQSPELTATQHISNNTKSPLSLSGVSALSDRQPCVIDGAKERISFHSQTIASTNEQLFSSSFEQLPTLRIKAEELQRSISSPQTTREIITLENPRSSHCPVIRPGPALGCNFCWNTIDSHGRILRRKTKYHCPECQTNLCIVPCFQEYHERLNNESQTSSNVATDQKIEIHPSITSKSSTSTLNNPLMCNKTGSI